MADLWMDVDVALAEVPVNLMPLIDDADFKSIEASLVYNQAGLVLVWNFVTCAGAFSQTAVTPTTGGVYDWANQGNGMYTIEIPDSGGGTINNDTEGFGWFTGVATGVLPWRGPVIGFRAAGMNDSLIETGTAIATATEVSAQIASDMQSDPTDYHVNVMELNGTAQTAGDLGAGVAAIQAVTDVIPDAGALTTIDTAVAAIQAVTDVIPDAGALTTIDTAVAAIQAVTDVIPDAGALTDLLADIASILADTGTDGVVLKAAGLAADAVDEIIDEVVEGTTTLRQALRLLLAALVGDTEDNGLSFRDLADSKDRFTVTVDEDANRNVTIVDAT